MYNFETTHKDNSETTPNNKSWIDEFDLKFSTLVEFHPDGSTTRKGVPRGMIEFISSLLEQERKAERERVLEEVIEMVENSKCDERKVKIFSTYEAESYEEKMFANAVLQEVITKLNQLKSE